MRPDPNEVLVRFDGEDFWHRLPPREKRKGTLPGTVCGRYKGQQPAVAQLRRDTEEEVCEDCERGQRIRLQPRKRSRWANEVENAPLREAFLKSGLSFSELARRLDVDSSWPPRALGLRPTGAGRTQHWVRLETAARLIRAMGLDPHEAGI
jgi:hypothetical protein